MIISNQNKKITDPDQGTQLSNIESQTFKSDLVKISDDIFNCPLILSDGKTMSIPVRKDGMVNATALCKAGVKKFNDYTRQKQTQAYLQALENVTGIPVTELINTTQGGIPEYQGTYVHRKVGLHLAQWIDPYFAIQVSRWKDDIKSESNKELISSQSSDIVEFKLTLKNNTELSIPVSKDGYVNCTKLCQAGGKRIDNWNRLKQSKELLEAYSKLPHIPGSLEKAVPHIRGTAFCRVIDGGNTSLNNQGTYYPMDIAIQIAQWIDPYFALQVSRWTRELLLFGSVTLGQEKSTQELENKFQEQIKVLTQEKEKLSQEHCKLVLNHEKLLKKRVRTDYETGNVVYIISHEAFSIAYNCFYFKFGKSTQKKDETRACFKQRLSTYNTGAPINYKVHYLLYVENNTLIEDNLKEKYSKHLDPMNKEWVKDVGLKDIVSFIRSMAKLLSVNSKEIIIDPILQPEEDSDTESDEDEEEPIKVSLKKTVEETVEETKVDETKVEETKVEPVEETKVELVEEPEEEEQVDDGVKIYNEVLMNLMKYETKELFSLLKEYGLEPLGRKNIKQERLKDFLEKKVGVVSKYDDILNERDSVYKNQKTPITKDTKTKKCCKCGDVLALNDFYKDKTKVDGIEIICRFCRNISRNKNRNDGKLKKMHIVKKCYVEMTKDQKWCIQCEKVVDQVQFTNNKRYKDGKEKKCKQCISVNNKESYMKSKK